MRCRFLNTVKEAWLGNIASSRITITSDAVIKSGPFLEVEYRKMIAARDIAVGTKMFRVPKVLSFDGTELIMERIRGYRPIKSALAHGASDLFSRAGQALRIIHRDLVLPDAIKTDFISYNDIGENCFIHGDFSTENVGYIAAGNPEICILDWSISPIYGHNYTYGSRYFDVCWFLNNLFCRPRPTAFLAPDRARHFLNGYFRAPGLNLDNFYRFHDIFRERRIHARRESSSGWRLLLLSILDQNWKRFRPSKAVFND